VSVKYLAFAPTSWSSRSPSTQPCRTALAVCSLGSPPGAADRSASSVMWIRCWITFSKAMAIDPLFVGSHMPISPMNLGSARSDH